jgi:hypothetical protein
MKWSKHPILATLVVLFSLDHAGAAETIKMETLTTTRNRTYQSVEIREVTPAGIKIQHQSGTATIPFAELPASVQKQLGGFDPAKAREYQAKADKAVAAQENAIEKELRETKESPATNGQPASGTAQPGGSSAGESKVKQRPSAEAAPAEGQPKPVNKGELSARIVGYKTGIKRVQFTVRTNCPAKLEVHQVAPDGHSRVSHSDTFTIEPNQNFVREIWVLNNYSGDLTGADGSQLDSESSDKKTQLNGLARPSLMK